jgi:GAF domain-containing protein
MQLWFLALATQSRWESHVALVGAWNGMKISAQEATQSLIALLSEEPFHQEGISGALRRIVQIGRELLGADIAVVFALNPLTGSFLSEPVISASLGDTDLAMARPLSPRPEGLTRQVMQSRSLFVEDLESPEGTPYANDFTKAAGVKSFAAVALPTTPGQQVLAVLYLDYRKKHAFPLFVRSTLELFADQAALILKNLWLFESLHRVNDVGQLLTQDLSSERVLGSVVQWIQRATEADVAVLYRYDPATKSLVVPPEISGELLDPAFPQPSIVKLDDIASLAFCQSVPHFVQDSSNLYARLGGNSTTRLGNFEERELIRSTAALRLEVGGESVGVLFLNYRHPQRFYEPQKQVILSLASFAAIAIRNSGAFRALEKRQLERLEILRSIEREISRTLDLQRVLQTIIDQSRQAINADEAIILLYNRRNHALEAMVASGSQPEQNLSRVFPLGEPRGLVRWAFDHKKPVRTADVRTDLAWKDVYVAAFEGIASELDIPLLDDHEVLGVMNFESRRPDAFDQADEDFLVTLAEHAVLAIRNVQVYERSEAMARRLRALHEVDKQIIALADDQAHVIKSILKSALEMTNADAASLHLYYEGQTRITHLASDQDLALQWIEVDSSGEGQIERSIVSYVSRTKRSQMTLGDAQANPDYEGKDSIHSEVAVPLLSGAGELIGVLDLESSKMGAFSEDHVEMLELFASQVVLAIQNAEVRKRRDQELRRFKLLSKAGVELGQIAEMTEQQLDLAYDTVVRIAREHSDCEVVIRRYDPVKRELIAVKRSNREDLTPFHSLSVDEENLNAYVYRTRVFHVMHDVRNLPPGIPIKLSDPTTRSVLITPIEVNRETYYGNLALSHELPYHFVDADLELFNGLARLLALTISRLEAVKLKHEAELRASAAEAMLSVGQSAFELAHRLGNQLGGVEADIEEIREELRSQGVSSPEIADLLSEIVENVNSVLSLSKELKKGLAELRPTELASRRHVRVKVGAVLQNAQGNLPRIPPNVRVEFELENPETEVFLLEPVKIPDILHNLISNAIDAMSQGGTVRVTTQNTPHSVEVNVTDTGIGIPASELPKLFHLFYSTKGSTGFGLWSAQSYARATGGDLRVRSEVGKGTTFTLHLPRAESS